jgi:hypothetical protein
MLAKDGSAFASIRSSFSNPVFKHCLLGSALILTAFLSGNLLNIQAEKISDTWATELKYYSSKNQPNRTSSDLDLNKYINLFAGVTIAQKDILFYQMATIRSQANVHILVMKYFYTRYYMAIALASAAGIIAAGCLFYISKEGWKVANNYIINIFIVTSSIAIFVGAFPAMFQQDKNIRDNSALYIDYTNLENQLLTSLATQKSFEGKKLTLDEIIHSTNSKLNELNKIAVGFDSNSILKTPDVFEKFPKTQ